MVKLNDGVSRQLRGGAKAGKQPIRILHYIGSLDIGGSQTMIMSIYRNIDRSKIQFDFVIDRKNETFFKDEIESLGGKVYALDEYFKGYNYFSFTRQWKDFFREYPEYKIIHCHVRSVASIVLKIAKKNGFKTICHSHNISNGRGVGAFVKKVLQSNIEKSCDCFFACSRKAAEWLYGKDVADSKRCRIINNAIEVKNYCFNRRYRNEIRKRYSVPNSAYLIGHIGRFEKPKNHEFIFELIKEMAHGKDFVFALCGEGALKDEFCEKVKSNELEDKVIILPSTEECYKYYSAFDYFILPSLYEGLGMVLIEAQFSGLTCLVSPNIPEEAKISDNYIVEDLEIEKWRKRILKRQRNKERGKVELLENAKGFDVAKTANELQEFYLSCAGGLE